MTIIFQQSNKTIKNKAAELKNDLMSGDGLAFIQSCDIVKLHIINQLSTSGIAIDNDIDVDNIDNINFFWLIPNQNINVFEQEFDAIVTTMLT